MFGASDLQFNLAWNFSDIENLSEAMYGGQTVRRAEPRGRRWTAVLGLYSPEDRNDHLGVGIAMGKTYGIEKMNRPC